MHNEQENGGTSLTAVEAVSVSETGQLPHAEPKHTCEEMSRGSVWHRRPCDKAARFHEEDWSGKKKWFCGTHAPSLKKQRSEKRQAAYIEKNRPVWDAEAKRNRLRNAADDLLEVAKMVDAACENNIGGVLFESDSPLVKAARAAIAKAEGR